MDNGINGEDEVGNGHNPEEIWQDAQDGNCLPVPRGQDEGDALGSRGVNGDVFAPMPIGKDDMYYKMDHKHRGRAYIFNHETFVVDQMKPRLGTDKDCANLKRTFMALNFEVIDYKDLTHAGVLSNIKAAAKEDYTHHDCVVIAVLSHGESGIIYAKDAAYKPETLWSHFTPDHCPSLAGKPKMFFIQACRGDKLDRGVVLTETYSGSRTETDGEMYSYKIPLQADFLIMYSTVEGYYAWRNTTMGSWFVQSLCQRLDEMAGHSDLLTILTFVSHSVALGFESNAPQIQSMHRQKQIPCITSMLTRLLKFPGSKASTSGEETNKIELETNGNKELCNKVSA